MKKTKKQTQFIETSKEKLQKVVMKYFEQNPKAKRLMNKSERKKGDVQFLYKILIAGIANHFLAKLGAEYYVVPSNGMIAEILDCSPQWISEIAEAFASKLGMKKQTKEQINNQKFTKYRNTAWVIFNELFLSKKGKVSWSSVFFFRTKFYKEISRENAEARKNQNNQIINEVDGITETDDYLNINWYSN